MKRKHVKIIIVLIIIALIIGLIAVSPMLFTKIKVNSLSTEIKDDVVDILNRNYITDYTISENAIEEDYRDYYISVDIPCLYTMDDDTKLHLLYDICNESDGFFLGKATSTSEFIHIKIKVTSNGDEYYAYDRHVYYVNDERVLVNPYEDSDGNYDKNDPYYSNNDYNNDGYINDDEFQGAVGDWMDKNGY